MRMFLFSGAKTVENMIEQLGINGSVFRDFVRTSFMDSPLSNFLSSLISKITNTLIEPIKF